MAEDSTFVVHKEWLNNIKGLSIEQQDRIISDFVRYGTGLPMAHSDDEVVNSFVNMLKGRIDFSKDKYNQKIQMASVSGKKKKVDDDEILRLAREGKNSREFLVKGGLAYAISTNTKLLLLATHFSTSTIFSTTFSTERTSGSGAGMKRVV